VHNGNLKNRFDDYTTGAGDSRGSDLRSDHHLGIWLADEVSRNYLYQKKFQSKFEPIWVDAFPQRFEAGVQNTNA
jgi:hypothetical protein